jgi:DNA polymerase elongation subunit (family B)
MPNLETALSMWVADSDMVSLYPSIMRAYNISRMTIRNVMFKIEGKDQADIQNYYANLIHMRENSVGLCSEFHSLPSYDEMRELLTERLKKG